MNGHRTNGFGVKAVLMRRGRLLLLRKPNGEFDLPGGRVEQGEALQGALVREIEEETGLTGITITGLIGSWLYCKRAGLFITIVTFACNCRGGVVRLSPEHTDFLWVRRSDVRKVLPGGVLYGINLAESQEGGEAVAA